jgi:hypothetical protein
MRIDNFFRGLFRKRKELPENYWFELGKRLYRESGEALDPLRFRALLLIDAFGLPSGPYSAIGINPETKGRDDPEKDRIIADRLTNHPGVKVEEVKGERGEKGVVVSLDFRDIYPKGLPQELKEVLDSDTRAIMEIEYEHLRNARSRFEETRDVDEADLPIHYFRLPGGIDLFMRGYKHHRPWQEKHGEYLRRINKHARIIAIEGLVRLPFGESLEAYWASESFQYGDYDVLMKDAVRSGFNGLFTEVDARDISRIRMDQTATFTFPELPDNFFETYFEFLKREHPLLANYIGSPVRLKNVLMLQSTTREGIFRRRKIFYKNGKIYWAYPYLTKEGGTSFEPTFLELGQHLFSNALAAIKLLLIAKLMADGYLPKGPIIDYGGSAHLSSKSFFLKYPQYAMEVVLRTINELMAGKVEDLPEIYEIFRNPNWEEIIKEITKLVFKKPEDDPSKPVEIGPNQRQLLDYPIDFLAIYNLDPKTIMPSDEEIKRVIERLKLLYNK